MAQKQIRVTSRVHERLRDFADELLITQGSAIDKLLDYWELTKGVEIISLK